MKRRDNGIRILVGSCLLLLSSISVFAQKTFDVKDASKYFDVRIKVAGCEDGACRGAATFSFFKKGGKAPYQVIDHEETYVELGENGDPTVNVNLLYDAQSVLHVDDFNFDGMEDVAICNGTNGSYGSPSYSIYLSSRVAGKFVYHEKFSELGSHLGMFNIDKKKKTLSTFDKSGCCWHITEEYRVVNNRPVKIFEEVEDATVSGANSADKVKITTKRLVGGKWKTTVRYVKRED
jgi:hypothetical protein